MVRTSWEAEAISAIKSAVAWDSEPIRGQSALNRISPTDWKLEVMQRFQFGDLRFESPICRVVVEAESGGGLTNLVKYWPMIGRELSDRRFVLMHLFKVSSPSDYIAHRRLWDWTVRKMREDLSRAGVLWPSAWFAQIETYGPRAPSDPFEVVGKTIRAHLLGARTQRITDVDIKTGRIRIPIRHKSFLPDERDRIAVDILGESIGNVRWDPRNGPDRARSGILGVGTGTLKTLTRPNQYLHLAPTADGVRLD